jgi:Domain of unknown function (DUF4259)
MDTWGTGSFENESATDFIREVLEDGPAALEEAFEVVLDPDAAELEAEEGARAIAAAEIVLAQLNGDVQQVSDAGLRAWLQDGEAEDPERLRELAAEAVDRVLGPGSELPELWQDSPDQGDWLAGIQRLRAGLSS